MIKSLWSDKTVPNAPQTETLGSLRILARGTMMLVSVQREAATSQAP